MRRLALIVMLIVFSQTALAGLWEHRPHPTGPAEHIELADHQHLELADSDSAEHEDLCLHCHCHGGQSGLCPEFGFPQGIASSAQFDWRTSYQAPLALLLSPPPIV